MKRALTFFVLLATSLSYASTPVVPDTTLAQQTGNNTSAANTFQTQTNGNLGASNISKVPAKALLYPGFNGKLYAHFMAWFGGSNHMNVGYSSNNATQVASQVADMMSRGLDGAIVDWYGPNHSTENGTTKLLRAEAEKQNGKFQFAVMEDAGALSNCAGTVGCDITAQMISDLTYAYNTYEASPAYMRQNGRPMVFFFGVEAYAIDWSRVAAGVPGDPLFIQRNSGAFTDAAFNGAFAWPAPNKSNPADMGDSYLDGFYNTGVRNPAELAFGTGYKGFNDLLASWSAKRITNQNCGETFLNTFTQIAEYYSVNRELFAVQLATWNDYEEGTELESGIDNCVSVSASASASAQKVSWAIAGNANTVDHYTVFLSTDGVNLMTVGDVPASQTAYDFSGYSLAPGSYEVYVKAVGVPFMLNHMSAAVALTVASQPPTVSLTVTPANTTAGKIVSASVVTSAGSIAATAIDFGDGTVLTGTAGSHAYKQAGTYTVRATVTDNLGASSNAVATVTVSTARRLVPQPQPVQGPVSFRRASM